MRVAQAHVDRDTHMWLSPFDGSMGLSRRLSSESDLGSWERLDDYFKSRVLKECHLLLNFV